MGHILVGDSHVLPQVLASNMRGQPRLSCVPLQLLLALVAGLRTSSKHSWPLLLRDVHLSAGFWETNRAKNLRRYETECLRWTFLSWGQRPVLFPDLGNRKR